ncbi:MAG: class I SAM-dependent methyltransferase [Candidatus Woesearchaeota archaeon]
MLSSGKTMLDPKKAEDYQKFRLPNSSFHKAKYDRIMRAVSKRKSLSVLEIGSGTGVYTRFLLRDFGKVTAVDNDPEMVREAKILFPRARIMKADATCLPFRSNSFDVVFGVSVIHHIANRCAVFREAARVLRKGGLAVFCEPNLWNPMTAMVQFRYCEAGLTRNRLRKHAEKAGLRVIDIGTTLLRSPRLSRFTDRIPGWRIVERAVEKANLGVSTFVVAKK